MVVCTSKFVNMKDHLYVAWLSWIGIWFSLFSTCGDMWLNGVGQNRETDEDHDEDCVEEGFQLVR